MMLRFALRLLAFIVVLLIVLVGGLFLMSGERLAKIAGDQITNALGREVTISDELRPQLFPNLGVRTGAFSVAETGGEGALMTGDGLSVGVDLLALFSRRVDVKEITLIAPTLTLVKQADGHTNWSAPTTDDTAGGESGGAQSQSTQVSLANLSVQNGTVSYRDEASGQDTRLENVNIVASMPSPSAPLAASIDFFSNAQSASAEAELASLSRLLAGEMTGLILDAQIGKNTLRFAGDISSAGVVEGDIETSLPEPEALMALTGGAASVPAEFRPIEASGTLSISPDAIGLLGGVYRLGVNRLQGPLEVALDDVPFVSARLSGDALDLSFLSAEEGSANADAPAAEGTGWSTDPIDASGLSLLNADVRIDANSINLGTTAMQNVAATVTIDNARAVARLLEGQAFGGALVGQFVVNNRNGLSVAGEMDGKTVAVQSLLTDMAGFDRMRGAGDTQLSFLGVGQNLDQIMRSLSGNAALEIGQGDITGFDLASLFGGGDAADAVGDRAVTIFEALEASFTINEGVMRNDDLLISANLFEATGNGDIDLGRQSMDYTLRPRVFENDLTGGLSIPVKIKGPWASLRIYPDLEAVARDRLKVEEEKLRAEAEARLEAERQELEERANQRLEREKEKLEERLGEEIRRGLGGLFD